MSFKKSLIKGTYILSFYLLLSYFLTILAMLAQPFVIAIKGGQINWNLQIWLPLLVLVIISKILLIRDGIKIYLFQYLQYFGIYQVIISLRNIVFLIIFYIRYSTYPNDQLIEQLKLQTYNIGFNLILGIVLIYLGYRFYKEN